MTALAFLKKTFIYETAVKKDKNTPGTAMSVRSISVRIMISWDYSSPFKTTGHGAGPSASH
jgi:hypothetical protein